MNLPSRQPGAKRTDRCRSASRQTARSQESVDAKYVLPTPAATGCDSRARLTVRPSKPRTQFHGKPPHPDQRRCRLRKAVRSRLTASRTRHAAPRRFTGNHGRDRARSAPTSRFRSRVGSLDRGTLFHGKRARALPYEFRENGLDSSTACKCRKAADRVRLSPCAGLASTAASFPARPRTPPS